MISSIISLFHGWLLGALVWFTLHSYDEALQDIFNPLLSMSLLDVLGSLLFFSLVGFHSVLRCFLTIYLDWPLQYNIPISWRWKLSYLMYSPTWILTYMFSTFQLDQDGLHELNVQAFWQRKGGTYWVRYIHVEILGFTNSAIGKFSSFWLTSHLLKSHLFRILIFSKINKLRLVCSSLCWHFTLSSSNLNQYKNLIM